MRQLIKLSALSLIVLSQSAFAAEKNCLIIVVGGAKEWLSLLPGMPTDISIDVDAAARKEARRTGCRIISGHNQDEAEFKDMLKRASKPPYYKPGTNVHMTFTDHGAPQPGNGKGGLYIGKGISIPNKDFSQALTENFPRGSRMTFSTNICWGSMTEMVTAYNLDSHFDICGGTSTHPDHFSWNTSKIGKFKDEVYGPYSAVGLSFVADSMTSNTSAPSLARFHQVAKRGDIANIKRIPGFLSSTTYARDVLKSKGALPEVDDLPLEVFFGEKINGQEDRLFTMEEKQMKAHILKAMDEQCAPDLIGDNFQKFLSNFSELYKRLSSVVPAKLPEPYKTQALKSSGWLNNNKAKLADLVAKYLTVKREFWFKNKKRSLDPKQSEALKKEWEAIQNQHHYSFNEHLFHIRNMQEARTVADFLKTAKPVEKARFEKFVACEKRPVL